MRRWLEGWVWIGLRMEDFGFGVLRFCDLEFRVWAER